MNDTAKKKDNPSVPILVRFPIALALELRALCAHTDRPISRVIRAALREYLAREGEHSDD